MTLDQQERGHALLAKLQAVQFELELFKMEVKKEEDQFEEDFQQYLDTKDDYVRLTDDEGNVQWISKAFLVNDALGEVSERLCLKTEPDVFTQWLDKEISWWEH